MGDESLARIFRAFPGMEYCDLKKVGAALCHAVPCCAVLRCAVLHRAMAVDGQAGEGE